MSEFNTTSHSLRNFKGDFGLAGAKRLSVGGTALTGRFHAIIAINGNATLAAGCVVAAGDAPVAGDVLSQDVPRFLPLTTITPPSAGTILCYTYPDL